MRNTMIFFALAAAALVAHAQVYRCVGADGKVSYADTLCPASTNSARTVDGTARERAHAAERERVRHDEREDIAVERERLILEQQRLQLERERTGLQREQVRTSRETQLPAGYGVNSPARTGVDSYACEVAKRNAGVGANAESKMRSQREYEVACFGDKAADIEAQRAGKPEINIYTNPNCQTIGNTVSCH